MASRKPAVYAMKMSNAKETIRREARRLGFALCGFARLAPPPHAAFVRRWLAEGNAASMAYIGRGLAKRLEPARILPGARSVVTAGYRYTPPPLPPIDWRTQLRGRIAAYALGTDYHRPVERQLRALAASIVACGRNVEARAYVDTGPVLEREWAAAGGIGWFGKNTNILHTEEGSYFFLGEVLTTLELDPDPPLADHCGSCTRCLDDCPTAALKPGFVLDARLCIAYLTIEHRGMIPRELRPKVGNWIFGCDVCQEVCPWNERLIRQRGVPEAEALLPYLPDLLRLDENGFRRRFPDGAVRRAKRDGFVRNVAVALGNTHNPQAVPMLAEALSADGSPLVRAHAAWALGAIGDRSARTALEAACPAEPDEGVRNEIQEALWR